MPPPPPELFLEAVLSTCRANAHYIPPQGKGSLYMRPLLLGTGSILGLGPAPSYSFVVYAAAVGAYFKVTPVCFRAEIPCLHVVMAQIMKSWSMSHNLCPAIDLVLYSIVCVCQGHPPEVQ